MHLFMLSVQGNEVLATAKQAVAGVGSFFGTASKKLDWIGSSIDKKAQELLPTLTPSPPRQNPTKGSPQKADDANRGSLRGEASGQAESREGANGAAEEAGKKPNKQPQSQKQWPANSQSGDWDWGVDEHDGESARSAFIAMKPSVDPLP